jgi:hypothetical protein
LCHERASTAPSEALASLAKHAIHGRLRLGRRARREVAGPARGHGRDPSSRKPAPGSLARRPRLALASVRYDQAVRWPSVLLLAVVIACGAATSAPHEGEGSRYLDDRAYRRAELEGSLVSRDNDYARLRLAHYAGGDAQWDALPEWNPRVDVVRASEIDDGTAARVTMTGDARALALDAGSVGDDAAMRALGERAFAQYPSQLATYARAALVSRAAAARYGFWIDDARGVGGLVRAELADGSAGLALSCASCHTRADGGALVVGVGSDRLDLGALFADAQGGQAAGSSTSRPATVARRCASPTFGRRAGSRTFITTRPWRSAIAPRWRFASRR